MRILVVNPNTTQAVTDRITAVGRAAATAGTSGSTSSPRRSGPR